MLLRIAVQVASSEVVKVYQPMKLKVFVDDITVIMERRKKEEGFDAVDHGRRKRGKIKVIAWCSYLQKRSFRNAATKKEWVLKPAWKHEEWT